LDDEQASEAKHHLFAEHDDNITKSSLELPPDSTVNGLAFRLLVAVSGRRG
jgi:hypothetical protein